MSFFLELVTSWVLLCSMEVEIYVNNFPWPLWLGVWFVGLCDFLTVSDFGEVWSNNVGFQRG